MQSIHTVSETALLTLRSRALEAGKKNPLLVDPVGRECHEVLLEIVPGELKERIMKRRLSPFLTMHLALRARKYDHLCREFLEQYPDGLIVSLGSGFDTRFWRLGLGERQYMELDLPEVIRLKKQILGPRMTYPIIEGSVLEETWMNEVKSFQSVHVLFLAEGLFMYFPPGEAVRALQNMAGSFSQSRLVIEVVHEKYTRGSYKRMVERKMRRRAGTGAGEYFLFGIRRARDLESFHPDFRIREEWSFFNDPDIKPSFLRIFRHWRIVSRSQYTVIADIA
jgi:O-methyltransferase involved in polyketide biosynthesis